jgi:archaellum component FlaF (FlaF/FlaG flagellin family)
MILSRDPKETPISTNGKVVTLALIFVVASVAIGILLWSQSNRNNNATESEERLDLIGQHLWLGGTGENYWTEAAIALVNSGERDVKIEKVTVSGVESSWNDVYYWKCEAGPVSSALIPTPIKLSGASIEIAVDGTNRTFFQASNGLTLKQGWTVVLYLNNPINITGHTVPYGAAIAIITENKLFYKEASAEWMDAYSFNLMGTEQMTFTNYVWGVNNTDISITVKNTGSSDLSIQDVRFDGNSVTTDLSPIPYPLTKGTPVTIKITPTTAFSHGVQYEFTVITSKGNTFGPYIKTAP